MYVTLGVSFSGKYMVFMYVCKHACMHACMHGGVMTGDVSPVAMFLFIAWVDWVRITNVDLTFLLYKWEGGWDQKNGFTL